MKDFPPISVIGCQFKIVGKILATRLEAVIDDLVSVKSTFIKGHQVLDGPMVLNEVAVWCKAVWKIVIILKVDLDKSYDTVRWNFLDDVLAGFGFGSRWRVWIQRSLRSYMGSMLVNGSSTTEF